MKFVGIRHKKDAAAVALMTFSLYGFLGNVMLDLNPGTNYVMNTFAIIYYDTLMQVIHFPIGFWGAGAAIYFGLFLGAFLILNRREPLLKNVLQTLRLASATVVLFELGLFYLLPSAVNITVMTAFYFTPLHDFTNANLLVTGVGLLIASQVGLALPGSGRRRHSHGGSVKT
jgi:hypothetical protein